MKKYYLAISLLFLLSCGGGGSTTESNTSDTSNSNRPITNTIRENTVPVGVSSFAMGVESKFPLYDTTEGLGYISIAESVKNIATNEVYLFAEQQNDQIIFNTLKKFIDDGYTVTHEIHVFSGPSMRSSADKWINSLMGRPIDDTEYVQLLQYDTTIQNEVLRVLTEVVKYARLLESIGVKVLICPELEDNQDPGPNHGYGVYLTFLDQLGWSRKAIVRVSMKDSFHSIPVIRYEAHNPVEIKYLQAGDIINTDGNDFYFNSDTTKYSFKYSEDEMRYYIEESQKRGIIFFIWTDTMQGIYQDTRYGYNFVGDRYNRTYSIEKPLELISLLLGIQPNEVIVR